MKKFICLIYDTTGEKSLTPVFEVDNKADALRMAKVFAVQQCPKLGIIPAECTLNIIAEFDSSELNIVQHDYFIDLDLVDSELKSMMSSHVQESFIDNKECTESSFVKEKAKEKIEKGEF